MTRVVRVSDENYLNEDKAHLLSVLFNSEHSRNQCTKDFLRAKRGPRAKKNTKD